MVLEKNVKHRLDSNRDRAPEKNVKNRLDGNRDRVPEKNVKNRLDGNRDRVPEKNVKHRLEIKKISDKEAQTIRSLFNKSRQRQSSFYTDEIRKERKQLEER